MDRLRQDVHRLGSSRSSVEKAEAAETRDLIRSVSKSIWKERYSRNFRFFCPFCATPRRLGLHPRPGQLIHFLQVGLTAVMFTLVAWPLFEAKGLVSFIPLWIAFEVFYRARVRASLACGNCGFDPVLYLVDVPRAKQAIRERWESKRAAFSAASQQEGEVEEVTESEESEPFPAETDEDSEMTQTV